MGQAKNHHPVKLIIGFIAKNDVVFDKALWLLKKRFGGLDFESKLLPFTYTDYYEKEFGKDLFRKFVSFKSLIMPQELAKIKVLTNRIEKKFSCSLGRSINIDPGYLDMAKLVLASTKNFRHRIYLNYGIFAEITLFYQGKSFKSWELSYPDYRTSEYLEIFNRIREIYAKQSKNI